MSAVLIGAGAALLALGLVWLAVRLVLALVSLAYLKGRL